MLQGAYLAVNCVRACLLWGWAGDTFIVAHGTMICVKALFGPEGYGHGGGVESHKDFGHAATELSK